MLAPANYYFCFLVCLQPVKMLHSAPLHKERNALEINVITHREKSDYLLLNREHTQTRRLESSASQTAGY